MLLLLLVPAAAPWVQHLAFHPLAGWQTGASGNTRSAYVGQPARATVPLESTAWIARSVRYQDDATADPPNRTLAHLPRRGIIVWAVIATPVSGTKQLRLDLGRARHLACCEGEPVADGSYELVGYGPMRTYSAIIRIYFGSRPTKAMLAQAQRALNELELPAPR